MGAADGALFAESTSLGAATAEAGLRGSKVAVAVAIVAVGVMAVVVMMD